MGKKITVCVSFSSWGHPAYYWFLAVMNKVAMGMWHLLCVCALSFLTAECIIVVLLGWAQVKLWNHEDSLQSFKIMSVSHNEARTHPSLSPPNNAIILNTMPSYLWEQCCIMDPYRDSLEQNSHDLITSEKCHRRSLLHSTPSFFLIQSSWQSKWPASLAHLSGLSHISSLLPALPVSPPTTLRAPTSFSFLPLH